MSKQLLNNKINPFDVVIEGWNKKLLSTLNEIKKMKEKARHERRIAMNEGDTEEENFQDGLVSGLAIAEISIAKIINDIMGPWNVPKD